MPDQHPEHKSFTIIADGPFLEQALLEATTKNRTVVALDGAANHLRAFNIKPDVILGDFDSINPASQAFYGIHQTFKDLKDQEEPYIGLHGVRIVPQLDQNLTDLEKAILYCDEHQATNIIILCASGGREDQHEGMKIALKHYYKRHRPMMAHS